MSNDPVRAEDVEAEEIDWLWRERIPRGMITVIGGKPDQGKGLFCAHLAAYVSRMDVGGRPGRVLLSAQEDSHGLMTRPRLEAAGADLANVHLWRFQIPFHGVDLAKFVIDKEIDLVIMDPFAAHLSGNISRHSDNVRQVLSPLTALIEQTRTAVVITEHVLKRVGANSHPLAAIGGSGSGLPAASRMAFIFGKDPEDEDRRVLCCVKHNICEAPQAVAFEVDVEQVGKTEVPLLVFDAFVEFDASRLLKYDAKVGQVGRPPDKREQAAEWLTNYLYDFGKPVGAGTVIEDAKQNGLTVKTLRAAAEDMGIVRDPPGGGRSCKWSLSDELLTVLRDADPNYDPKKDSESVNVETVVEEPSQVSDDEFNAFLGGLGE